ncbi:MAG: DUF4160 domain-containing protein [Deltaproteobacteria bacterium]|nr:DUF4160 domain-containing protein [Deltaproteobacteria bacterium]
MGRIKRGGYFFRVWVGDHPPLHVHVSKDDKTLAKVELNQDLRVMEGEINRRIKKIIRELIDQGLL